MRVTERPQDASNCAAVAPAGPPPMTTTSDSPPTAQRSLTYVLLAYSVGSGTPASTNASCRSRHLLHSPQCVVPCGFMHDRLSSNGTPSSAPRRMTSALL